MNAALSQGDHQRWRAELSLGFERREARTVLARRQHVGPLLVQRPFYPEGDACHVYLVHPPGGIVGGDELTFTATLEAASHAVITTPAATKFYRSAVGRSATLLQEMHIAGATLEWLPQETILFRDACASMGTIVKLDGASRFIGWELTCYGRPASDELFDRGRTAQRFEIWIDDTPTLLDHLHIDGSARTMQTPWGLAGNMAIGTLLAFPAAESDVDAVRELGVDATLVDRVLVCRSIGGERIKQRFVNVWQALRPRIVGREAVLPRIWAT